MIFASIRHNLANLLRFSGRESRALFWPYAIALFLLSIAAYILLFVPVMMDMMTRIAAYAQAHPEGLPKAAPGQPPMLPPELMPDVGRMVFPSAAIGVAVILLLAAAVVRRLHDRGKPGWWGALPLPFKLFSLLMAPAAARTITTYPPTPSPLATLSSLNGLCSLVATIILIVMLAGETERGPNRYDDGAPRA